MALKAWQQELQAPFVRSQPKSGSGELTESWVGPQKPSVPKGPTSFSKDLPPKGSINGVTSLVPNVETNPPIKDLSYSNHNTC